MIRATSWIAAALHHLLKRVTVFPRRRVDPDSDFFTAPLPGGVSHERWAAGLLELRQLHNMIYWYDDVVMSKKSWCLGLWVPTTALAIYQRNVFLTLLGLATVMGFALSELVLRRYQRRYVVRAEYLESLFATSGFDNYRFELAATAGQSERWREIWYALKQPHFTIYYGFYAVLSLALAFLIGRSPG